MNTSDDKVPEDAIELAVEATESGALIGLWRGPDDTIYVAYYHAGPSTLILKHKLADSETWTDDGYLRALHEREAEAWRARDAEK